MGNNRYLCGMIKGPTTYLKTDTSTLTRGQLRMIAEQTIDYCIRTLGVKRSKSLPTFSLLKRSGSRKYGQYDVTNNHIQIHYNVCGTVQLFIQTIIHEYTHYIQNLRHYQVLYRKFGYDNHPQEIEARKNEKLYSPCWKQIKHNI